MDDQHTEQPPHSRSGWIPLNEWLDGMGLSAVSGWRWRKRGWLRTIRVGSRHFITPEALAEFQRRAAAGEFQKVPKA